MKYTTFNIGLNNNALSYEFIANVMAKSLLASNAKVDVQLVNGTYIGDAEPTAVVRVIHKHEYQDALWADMMANTLCDICTQECIPYRHVNDGEVSEKLVYNTNFKGDKYDFDGAYFIDFADEIN